MSPPRPSRRGGRNREPRPAVRLIFGADDHRDADAIIAAELRGGGQKCRMHHELKYSITRDGLAIFWWSTLPTPPTLS
jgi:hypothetical protein